MPGSVCLLSNCCFLSETSRMLELYRALSARGASVRVVTQGGPHEQALVDAGVAYDVLGERMTGARCEAFVRSLPGLGPPDQSMWSDDELRAYAAAEVAYFREHDVRVAVTGWTLTALLSTRVAGIPLVTEHAGAFLPPLMERGLLPAPSRRVGMPLEGVLPRRVRRFLFNRGLPRRAIYTHGFNRVAAELGVPGIPSFPALLLGDLTLVTDVPEVLGLPREAVDGWRPRDPRRYREGTRLRYVGPIYARLATALPERVDAFLDEPGRPLAYVALTSTPRELVRDVVGALRALDVRILVAATVHDLRELEDDRVLVEGVLPSHLVMPRVDLAVTAGGQGSVQTALASGVPLVGIPLHAEQDANLACVERLGVARAVPPAEAGGPTLARAAAVLLADEAAAAEARRLRSLVAAVDGPGAAADAVLELLSAEARAGGRPPGRATARRAAAG